MKKVLRSELVDFATYTDRRASIREVVQQVKALRRIHVGEYLTFLFENADTMRYQVQEMMRVEQLVRESSIQHELDTYNALLGDEGELGCTLLVEVEDTVLRDRMLVQFVTLPDHLYVELEDGRKVRATVDEAQRSRGRLSTVQYLKFAVGRKAPVAVGCDHPEMSARTRLTPEQRTALQADLES
ncbi:MAG: DUF3501 family protein [Planctomycetes bacterium]|nr:DUF3501 family protein [Planctomycetota bacterium]